MGGAHEMQNERKVIFKQVVRGWEGRLREPGSEGERGGATRKERKGGLGVRPSSPLLGPPSSGSFPSSPVLGPPVALSHHTSPL